MTVTFLAAGIRALRYQTKVGVHFPCRWKSVDISDVSQECQGDQWRYAADSNQQFNLLLESRSGQENTLCKFFFAFKKAAQKFEFLSV